jgi:hypothetical protein
MVEHEGHRAGLGKIAAGLGEGRAHLAGRAIAVVGQHLDDDGDAARSVALVADLVVALGVAAGCLLDRAVDVVLGHVLGARGEHRRAQARIHGGVGQAELGGDGDFTRELAEQLGFHRILPPLAVHDVLELGMAGHDLLLDGAPRARSRRSASHQYGLIFDAL